MARSKASLSPGSYLPLSIEMMVWVAIGGRGTLIGPIVGAFAVNGLKSWFTAAFPDLWLFALGLLFILVTLFLRKGIVGTLPDLKRLLPGRAASKPAPGAKEETA